MATQLSIFNEALRILGQPPLLSPEANVEEGRQLRDAWEGAVRACYEEGNWNWTITRAQLGRLAEVPVWGYSYYYGLPADMVRLVEISQTGVRNDPLLQYEQEVGRIATDAEVVYIRYVSGSLLTFAPGNWAQGFADFVAATLALRTAPKLNTSAIELANSAVKSYRNKALGFDAIGNPPEKRKPGSWARAALGGRRDREHGD